MDGKSTCSISDGLGASQSAPDSGSEPPSLQFLALYFFALKLPKTTEALHSEGSVP